MPHPLLIGWLLKQATVANVYAAGKVRSRMVSLKAMRAFS